MTGTETARANRSAKGTPAATLRNVLRSIILSPTRDSGPGASPFDPYLGRPSLPGDALPPCAVEDHSPAAPVGVGREDAGDLVQPAVSAGVRDVLDQLAAVVRCPRRKAGASRVQGSGQRGESAHASECSSVLG